MSTQDIPIATSEVEVPSEAELIARARALHPLLRERAEAIDAMGYMPDDIIQAFHDAGFFKILQPKEWGGYQYHPLTFIRVLMEVCRGSSGSAAWIMMILGAHQWEYGSMDRRACEDVWGEDTTVLTSSAYAPAGKAVRVDGGYMISGKWLTSSGCMNSKWAFVGSMQPCGPNGELEWLAHLAPLDQAEIQDDWDVFGLAGTGSRSIVFEEVFIPDYRTHSLSYYKIDDRSPESYYPFRLIFWSIVSSLVTGFGQCAIDMFIEKTYGKKRTGNPEALHDNPRIKEKLGHAQAVVNSCRSRIEYTVQVAQEYAERGELMPESLITQHFDVARTAEQVQQAVVSLFTVMGASVAAKSNPFQRIFRDTMVACVHLTQRFDEEADLIAGQMYADYAASKNG